MTEIHFAFGKAGLTLEVPDGPEYQTVESPAAQPLTDVETVLDRALDYPVAGEPLTRLAQGKRTAAIAVCDITRPAPNRITLPPILERLHKAGIGPEGVTLLIATGLHRDASREEIDQIVGPEIASRYRVLNHDARAEADHRWLGVTRGGTPAYIDRRFLDADLHLSLGLIEQHLMLGFSGGRKLIAPGLAGERTIKTIHSPKFMRDPMATEGSITENPLHAELLEIAQMARHDFILDVTLTRERSISGVFAGSPVEAHAAGVDFLRRTLLEKLSGLADVAITSAAGYPLDLTFYQTIKGITAAQHLVKPGGKIVVLASCDEGIGSPEFARKLASYSGHQEYLEQTKDTEVIADQWQLEKLALVGLKHELFFYTPGAPRDKLGSLGKRCFSSAQAAVGAALDGLPPGGRVLLIPEGPYVYARVAS